MNKKGFTLIELLSVLILLSVIFLIATPAIINIIENARKKVFEDTAYGVLDALRLNYIERIANGNSINIENFTFPNSGLKLSGEEPYGGNAEIDKSGNISFALFDKDKKWCAKKDATSEKVKVEIYNEGTCFVKEDTESGNDINDGQIVYFNPETGKLCSEYKEENSINETKTGCLKWYTFGGNNKSDYINLILDHNTTYNVVYNSYGDASMSEAKTALINDTISWKKDLEIRLITANEIAQITGNKNFNSATSGYKDWFYLDTNSTSYDPNRGEGTSKYYYLFDYLNSCSGFGCKISDDNTYGYWVQTPVKDRPSSVWYVSINGTLSDLPVTTANACGIRPVITVRKSEINM